MNNMIRLAAILSIVAATLVGLRFGLTWTSAFAGIVCAFLILIAVFDYRYRKILNVLVIPGMSVAFLVNVLGWGSSPWGILAGGAVSILLFAAVKWLKPDDLGGGDVKLAGLIGVLFGFPNALLALTFGVLLGGAVVIYLVVLRKASRKTQIPYAPCLCLGAIAFLLASPTPFAHP